MRTPASTPRCGTALHRCGRCSRRSEPDNDAQRNCLEKPPGRIGRTRWNPGPQSVRVQLPVLHRQSLAKSKDRGREGSPSKRRKWLCGKQRIFRGSPCLRGNPQGERESPYAAVPPPLSGRTGTALSLLPSVRRPRLAIARTHRIVQHRVQMRTDPVAKPGERSAPLRSRRMKQGSLTPDRKRPEPPRRTSSFSREDCRCRAEAGAAARESRSAPIRRLHALRGSRAARSPVLPIRPTGTLA